MGLVVSAEVIRELIADGEYVVECIEQRQHGKVAATFSLRARAQPYDIQIETSDSRLEGLFRALLPRQEARAQRTHVPQASEQTVPVVEVATLPADVPRKRGRPRAALEPAEHREPAEATSAAKQRRGLARQLVLMAQEGAPKAAPDAGQSERARPLEARKRVKS
jgi:hypothetical protein